MKQVKFFTLGCKVNQYETQGLREKFLRAGFKENNTETADIYIINTCTVTAKADAESQRLIRRALRANPQSCVVVTGCLVEKDADEIIKISDKIQIIPNSQKHRIMDFLDLTQNAQRKTHNETYIPLSISYFQDHERAFVKIQDGCNNLCAYCKVPLVRGRSRSRSLNEIVAELTRLIDRGYKEMVLTGVCLGDYHYKNFDLVDALTSLEKIKGQFRIRLSSIEPQLISNDLIEKIADSARICPHLHIPLQSGDDEILKKMNRQYITRDYLSLTAKIKKKIKDVSITTDVLVGFPGENEKNFRNTVRCLKEILPLRTHIFSFSPRRETAAFNLQRRLDPRLIKERVNLLQEIASKCSHNFRKHFLGKLLTVLIESQPDRVNGALCGYSENYIRTIVENATEQDINKLVQVKLEDVTAHSTKAKIIR